MVEVVVHVRFLFHRTSVSLISHPHTIELSYRSVILPGLEVKSILGEIELRIASLIKGACVKQGLVDPLLIENILDIKDTAETENMWTISKELAEQVALSKSRC